MKRVARLTLLLFVLIVIGCTGGDEPAQPTEDETATIYATVIRQIYTEDDTFGGTLQPPTLYVVGTTDDRAALPSAEGANPAEIPSPVRESVSALLADLPTEIVWVETQDVAPLEPDTGGVVDGGAIITLGNITPQDDGSLHVPASIYVANLAAGGQTYVLEEVDGAWTITGNTGTEWIS